MYMCKSFICHSVAGKSCVIERGFQAYDTSYCWPIQRYKSWIIHTLCSMRRKKGWGIFGFLLTIRWYLPFFLKYWKLNTHLFFAKFAIPIKFGNFIFWLATYYQNIHCIFKAYMYRYSCCIHCNPYPYRIKFTQTLTEYSVRHTMVHLDRNILNVF